MDTSPGGDYYTSPSSPTSSSRNWTEDMEGGRPGGGSWPAFRSRLPRLGLHIPAISRRRFERVSQPGAMGPPGDCSRAGFGVRLDVNSGFAFPELFGSTLAGFLALCL